MSVVSRISGKSPGLPSQPPPVRLWLAILALLICYQAYYCLTVQKSLAWDASMGFLTLQSSLEHGDFNRIHHPVASDLTQDTTEFITWWTPGQYLIPHWFASVLGTDVGFALRPVALLFSLAGLVGCRLLYTKLGFNRRCVCLSLIVIATQHYFLKNSRVYSGGDLLLFSAAPYVALGVLSVRASLVSRALIVAVACFAALFLKASALTLFLALVFHLALEIRGWPDSHGPAKGGRNANRQLLVLGGILAVYVLAAHLVYLSKAAAISASARPWDSLSFERLWGIPVALAGPVYGAFSFLEPYNTRTFFIPMAFLGLLAVWKLGRDDQERSLTAYRRMFVAHYVAFVVFFSYVYIRGMSISYEARHFRFLGLLLVPGLIHVLLRSRHHAMLSAAVVMLSLSSLVLYHWVSHSGIPSDDSLSRWGIRQPLSNASLEAMHRLDDTRVTADTIVFNGFGACPALLLEFNHGRKLQDDNWLYYGWAYSGRATTPMPWYRNAVESIVLIVPKNTNWYFGPTLQEIAVTFERPLHVVPYFENSELILYLGRVY